MEQPTLSLAVKYRPRSFASIVGQRPVVEVLRRAVVSGRVPQQLLFSGRSGLGKTTIARVVAAALLCETPLGERDAGDVCGHCSSCLDALDPTRVHPDLVEFDAASHGGKDEIRDIAARCHVAPLRSKVKVYIVDEAHGLSGPGGQAFLKILEEPPEHVVFMLCTTDPQKMLKTNRGRCVEFELLLPNHDELLSNLNRVCAGEEWDVSDDILRMVLEVADPDLGVRGSVTTLAKLASVLGDGPGPTLELAASLLGVAPPRAMERLVSRLTAGDRSAALAELASLRTLVADGAIRSGLLRWANEEVRRQLTSGSAGLLDLAVWRLEQVLAAPDAPSWLDVLVARLAHPDADGPPQGVVDQARLVLAELRAATTAAVEATEHLAPPAASSASAPGLTPEVAQLLAAAAPAPVGLGEVLMGCQVRMEDGVVLVLVPEAMTARISPFNSVLKTAAGRLGSSLRMRRLA